MFAPVSLPSKVRTSVARGKNKIVPATRLSKARMQKLIDETINLSLRHYIPENFAHVSVTDLANTLDNWRDKSKKVLAAPDVVRKSDGGLPDLSTISSDEARELMNKMRIPPVGGGAPTESTNSEDAQQQAATDTSKLTSEFIEATARARDVIRRAKEADKISLEAKEAK